MLELWLRVCPTPRVLSALAPGRSAWPPAQPLAVMPQEHHQVTFRSLAMGKACAFLTPCFKKGSSLILMMLIHIQNHFLKRHFLLKQKNVRISELALS